VSATVELVQDKGDGDVVVSYASVHGNNTLSETANSFMINPLRIIDGSPTRSYERWTRLRFTPPFGAISAIRFWVPNYSATPGWTVRYGTADIFSSPVMTASSIATFVGFPTSDPGEGSPNLGGETPLTGEQVQYSKYLVVQSVVQDSADLGPILGYDEFNEPIPFDLRVAWLET
jgi:hypothetical protein